MNPMETITGYLLCGLVMAIGALHYIRNNPNDFNDLFDEEIALMLGLLVAFWLPLWALVTYRKFRDWRS